MEFNGEQDHLEFMQSTLNDAWAQLNFIWQRVGYDENSLLRRRNTVVRHFKELLDDMCQEATSKLEEQQQRLKNLMAEITQLASDLSMDPDRIPELETASGKPLIEMDRIFQSIVDDLSQRKAIRMEKYNGINAQVIELSEELDEVPFQIEFQGIPADNQVNRLQQHLTQLQQDKVQRLQQFYNYRKSIAELFELLETSPVNDLEKLVVDSDEINSNCTVTRNGRKVLSQDTLQALESLKVRLEEKLEANSQEGEQLWNKIRELWSRLSADEEMTLIFTQVHRPISTNNWNNIYKPSVIKGLQKEFYRLEEEKRLNMSLFVKQCREELCNLWLNKCFMASVQDRFMESNYAGITPFAITDFNEEECTEDLLEKHEKEVEFWQNFIERNKRIIEGVSKRSEMFGQYKILDQKSDDPSRLANRGGALLKEEKERKKLEKAIPKLESELKQLCDEFELEQDAGHGMSKFLVYGRTINEMIEQDWDQFHEEKRLRKEAKKKPNDAAPGNKTMMTTQMGNPGSRKRPATPSSAQRGAVTPVKRNKTTALTPGKTLQSPFLQPSISAAPSNSTKRPLTKLPRVTKQNNKKQGNQSMNRSCYFRPNTSSAQAASRRILRKSIDKLRNGSSLLTDSSSSGSSSSFNVHKNSSSQPNLRMNVGSMEQLNFTKVIRGHGPPLEALKEMTPKKNSSKDNFAQPSSGSRSVKKTPTNKTGLLTRHASAGKLVLPTKLTGKEQVPPQSSDKNLKDSIISPVTSYSEFTDHLLCQSTLNSSTVVPIQKAHAGNGSTPTTPTKSGMSFAPAKLPLTDNCF